MRPSGGRSSSLSETRKEGIHARNLKSAISVFSKTAYKHQRNFSIPSESMIKESHCRSARQRGLPLLNERLIKSGRASSKYYKNIIKIENYLEKKMIENLKKAFANSTNPKNGLTLHEFRRIIIDELGVAKPYNTAIDRLFTIINWRGEKYITWDLFCTYILVEFEKQELVHTEKRKITFDLPARIRIISSRDVIIHITSGLEGSFTTYSRDGVVTTWTAGLEVKKRKVIQTTFAPNRTVPKWIMCCAVLGDFNKILLGTSDRELLVVDLPSFESYFKVTELDVIPLFLETSSSSHDEWFIIYADKNGCLTVIVIHCPGECLRLWKKYPPSDGFPHQTFARMHQNPNVDLFRWKVHSNWIQNMKHYTADNLVISCCNEDRRSVVIGIAVPKTNNLRNTYSIKVGTGALRHHQRPKDELVIDVYKGVKAFAFSRELNLLITGGLDRQLRCWNPYVPHRPTAILRGHRNPIIFIHISAADDKVYSISTEANIKIWDIKDLQCILSIGSRSHSVQGELSICHYSGSALMLCTDKIAILPLKRTETRSSKMHYIVSHDKQITSICYSSAGDVMASSGEDSTIKVWDIEEGILISEIRNGHGRDIISCVCFDSTGLRLISCGYDGAIRVWNYVNGQCLAVFGVRGGRAGRRCEFVSCDFSKVGQNNFIIGVDSDKVISIFADECSANDVRTHDPTFEWQQDGGDIHCVKYWNNFLATCSSSGSVVIWNMISGHVFSRLHPENTQPLNDSEEWMLIRRITIMHTRTQDKNNSMLIASGPYNKLHFWNPYLSHEHASFPHPNDALITSICTNKSDKLLISGDEDGFINIWNIVGYANTKCPLPPPHVNNWKAHSHSVTEIIYVDNSDLIVSSSSNRTIKMWDLSGVYIGTFGQNAKWHIMAPETYRHPNVEVDILTEPMENIQTDDNIIDEIVNLSVWRNKVTDKPLNYSGPIGDVNLSEANGRRLRRERQQLSNIYKLEGNEFHKLDIHSLTPCKF